MQKKMRHCGMVNAMVPDGHHGSDPGREDELFSNTISTSFIWWLFRRQMICLRRSQRRPRVASTFWAPYHPYFPPWIPPGAPLVPSLTGRAHKRAKRVHIHWN